MDRNAHLKFRPATPSDFDAILDLIVDINKKVGAVYGIPMEAGSVVHAINHTIKEGICLVGDGACAGGFIHPYIWNHAMKIGLVLFWNYRKPGGIRIFQAMVEEFKRRGATHVSCSSHFPKNTIGRHYLKRGAHPVEVQYLIPLVNPP